MEKKKITCAISNIDENKRQFSGLATAYGESRGIGEIRCKNITEGHEVPFILDHESYNVRSVVGTALFYPQTNGSIRFVATIPTIEEESDLKNELQDIWLRIRYGLLKAVSIGAYGKVIKEDKSNYFLVDGDDSLLELSLVAIGAHPQAKIDNVSLAATMQNDTKEKEDSKIVLNQNKEKPKMQDKLQHLENLKSSRQEVMDKKLSLMNKVIEGNRVMEQDEIDEDNKLQAQLDAIDASIIAAERFVKQIQQDAKPIQPIDNPQTSMRAPLLARNYGTTIKVNNRTLEERELAGQILAANLLHKRDSGWTGARSVLDTIAIYNKGKPSSLQFTEETQNYFLEAASSARTDDNGYLGILTDWNYKAFGQVMNNIKQQSLALTFLAEAAKAPINSMVATIGSKPSATWVAEGAAKQKSHFMVEYQRLKTTKQALILVATEEQLEQAGSQQVANLFMTQMENALVTLLDTTFLSPRDEVDSATQKSQAGVWKGSPLVTPSGTPSGTPATVALQLKDLQNLLKAAKTNVHTSNLMSKYRLIAHTNFVFDFWGTQQLTTVNNLPSGVRFTSVDDALIGYFGAIPIYANDYVNDGTNPTLGVVDIGQLIANVGSLRWKVSDVASITDGTTTESMWQTNQVAYLLELHTGWLSSAYNSTPAPGAYLDATTTPITEYLNNEDSAVQALAAAIMPATKKVAK